MKKLRITVGKKTYDVTVEVLGEDQPAADRSGGHLAVKPASVPRDTSHPGESAANSIPKSHSAGAVVSPMAGVIKTVLVKPGDEVAAGAVLVILEAMKMDNKITANSAGTVARINVQEGQSVHEGQELVTLE